MVYAIYYELDGSAWEYGEGIYAYLSDSGYPFEVSLTYPETEEEDQAEDGEAETEGFSEEEGLEDELPSGLLVEIQLSTDSPMDAVEGSLPVFQRAWHHAAGKAPVPEYALNVYVEPLQ